MSDRLNLAFVGCGEIALHTSNAAADSARRLWEEGPPVIGGPGDSFVPSAARATRLLPLH